MTDVQLLSRVPDWDALIRLEAVRAAGEYEVKDAWPHVRAILEARTRDRELLLAAIAAAASINRDEAAELFADLDDSDEEIAEAIDEALAISGVIDDSWEDDED